MARLEYKMNFEIRNENGHRCDICCTYFSKSAFFMYNHMANRSCLRLPFNCEESNLEQYYCGICQLDFDTIISLKKHVGHEHSTIVGKNDFICQSCSFQTVSPLQWFTHVTSGCAAMNSTDKDKRWFECNKCVYKTLFKDHLSRHDSSKHANNDEKIQMKMFQCEKCTFNTKKKYLLKLHINAVHSEKQHKKWFHRTESTLKTLYKSLLNKHVYNKSTHMTKLLKCKRCAFETRNKYTLEAHILNKHRDKAEKALFKCEKCAFTTAYNRHLKVHIDIQHTDYGKKWFHCEKCTFKTLYECHLNAHINSTHTNKTESFKCEKFTTTETEKLKMHIDVIHTDDQDKKLFSCEECKFKTLYKSDLRQHIYNKHAEHADETTLLQCQQQQINDKHTNEIRRKSFNCEKCTFITTRKGHLKQHINAKHTDQANKWFQCDQCTFQTPHKNGLKGHVNTKHKKAGKEPLKCEKCSFTTTRKSHLEIHINVKHTDDKDKQWFRCDQCAYKTVYTRNLMGHVYNMHTDKDGKETFKCEKCRFTTIWKNSLMRHIDTKHSPV